MYFGFVHTSQFLLCLKILFVVSPSFVNSGGTVLIPNTRYYAVFGNV